MEKDKLKRRYEIPTIQEHLPVLRQLATECASVTEIGLGGIGKGLQAAIVTFLRQHREWKLHDHRVNSHGLTTLRRIT